MDRFFLYVSSEEELERILGAGTLEGMLRFAAREQPCESLLVFCGETARRRPDSYPLSVCLASSLRDVEEPRRSRKSIFALREAGVRAVSEPTLDGERCRRLLRPTEDVERLERAMKGGGWTIVAECRRTAEIAPVSK